MKLETMKAIADARTKGCWVNKGFYVEDSGQLTIADCFSTKNGNEDNNAKFIAMAANNFDKLLTIAKWIKKDGEGHDILAKEHFEKGLGLYPECHCTCCSLIRILEKE